MRGETLVTQATLPSVEVAERSDPGRDPTKQVNEDTFGHRETRFGVLAVVCDGMGGHVGGREASTAALATIFEAFESAPPGSAPRDVLRDAIRMANVRVRGLAVRDSDTGVVGPPGQAGQAAPPGQGGRPGSTVVAVLVHAGGTEIAHVGDSRVYLVHQGQIFQVTRDHSMVQEMVEAKILTPDQAAVHPDANKITRALGIDDDVDVELRPQTLAHVAGDALILCSDGLSDMVESSDILGIVSSDPPAQAVGKLVDLANARGGYDNITVVIVRPRASAPPLATGTVAMTIADSQLVTLRPPKEPPLMAVIPVAPLPAPPSVRAAKPSASLLAGLTLAAVGIAVAVALLAANIAGRGGKRTTVPFDAGLSVVTLGRPASSVVLAPEDFPEAGAIDAAGIAPLEPVEPSPSLSPLPPNATRHARGKPTKP